MRFKEREKVRFQRYLDPWAEEQGLKIGEIYTVQCYRGDFHGNLTCQILEKGAVYFEAQFDKLFKIKLKN